MPLLVSDFAVAGAEDIPTPALLIYEDRVDANIRAVLSQCGTTAQWRPHVKTAKIAGVMARYLTHGITNFKCATTQGTAHAARHRRARRITVVPRRRGNRPARHRAG